LRRTRPTWSRMPPSLRVEQQGGNRLGEGIVVPSGLAQRAAILQPVGISNDN
jgi:hypothetical protein